MTISISTFYKFIPIADPSLLQGKLTASDAIAEAGLSAQVKAPKP